VPAEHPLHLAEPLEPEGLGEANHGGGLDAGLLGEHGDSFQRHVVRVVQRKPGNLLEAVAEIAIAGRDFVTEILVHAARHPAPRIPEECNARFISWNAMEPAILLFGNFVPYTESG
jgi:hypothetical protein